MKRIITILALGLVMVSLGACGHQAEPTSPNTDTASGPTGNIPPDYQALIQRYEQGEQYYDLQTPPGPMTVDPADSNWDAYMITIVWGSFSPDPSVTPPPVDWTGTFDFSSTGTFADVMPIDFDPGEDSLAPHDPPVNRLAWQSFTSNDLDGLHMLLLVDPNATITVVPQVRFETHPVTFTYDLDQLVRLQAFYLYGTGGVAIQAFKIPHPDCPHGRLFGHWLRDSTDHFQGTFGGVWVNHNLVPFGLFKGEFWQESDGTGKFDGTIADFRNNPIGTMSGTWYYDDPGMCPLCGDRHGVFDGHFQLENGRTGTVSGDFGALTDSVLALDLRLRGNWQVDCPTTDSTSD